MSAPQGEIGRANAQSLIVDEDAGIILLDLLEALTNDHVDQSLAVTSQREPVDSVACRTSSSSELSQRYETASINE